MGTITLVNLLDTYRVITAGRKPRDSMKSRGIHIDKSHAAFPINLPMNMRAIMHEALSLYERHEVDEVIMIYTRFVKSMTQIAQAERLLPIEANHKMR